MNIIVNIKEIENAIEAFNNYLDDETGDYVLESFAISPALNALEKQIPKKPKNYKIIELLKLEHGNCPTCGFEVAQNVFENEIYVCLKTEYCSKCGQRLKWREGCE